MSAPDCRQIFEELCEHDCYAELHKQRIKIVCEKCGMVKWFRSGDPFTVRRLQ